MDDTDNIIGLNIYFPFGKRQNDAIFQHDPRREKLVILRVACLATSREPLGASLLPAKRSCRPGSLPVAFREMGLAKPSLPGSPGLLFSSFVARPTPNWSGIGCNLDVASQ